MAIHRRRPAADLRARHQHDAAERKRLEKELADVEKRLAACTAKLGNAKFTANAKPEIVEAERARQADLEKSKAAVQESLAELS
ncbi:MAG: hypothetical protein H6816_01355 [Phycisphaerales bacterium]|nr:hypothetical protein [Phycisphaerales bacterium]